jgi:hypothetical protein
MNSKRFQVFVSSTFEDLKEERSEVMQALLELDCMPAGMELFPSASEEQWNWIKKVIEESDYYLVILANRYGSISKATGQSYTEMEYRYAIEIGKPVIAFLHSDPERIESKKSEQSVAGKKKLDLFRLLCKSRLVKFWSSPSDLGAKVSRSVTQLFKHEPAIGWVRADEIPEDRSSEILSLRTEVANLKEILRRNSRNQSVPADLARGQDVFRLEYSYETKKSKTGKAGHQYWVNDAEHDGSVSVTWDGLFAFIAPELIHPTSDFRIANRLNEFVTAMASVDLEEKHPGQKIEYVRIYSNGFDLIKIQLRALGLIEVNEDNSWQLTDQGDLHMINLLAVKKA